MLIFAKRLNTGEIEFPLFWDRKPVNVQNESVERDLILFQVLLLWCSETAVTGTFNLNPAVGILQIVPRR